MPIFRAAGRSDVDRVVRLVESAYRRESSRVGWTTEADLLAGQRTDRAEVEALLEEPGACLLLALEADQLVGCVLIKTHAHGTAHIGMFAVSPTLQARGLGRALLAEAERVARQEGGAVRAKMTVIEQRSELIAWYRRRGYHTTGETEPFPYGNARFGLPLRDDLRFSVLEKSLVEP